MPFAVTHVILTIVLVGLFRDFFMKHKFSTSFLELAGFAGLLPDAGIVIDWLLAAFFNSSTSVHRLYTHSVIWAVLFAAIAVFVHFSAKKKQYNLFQYKIKKNSVVLIFAIIAFGWLIHILLDCMLAGTEHLTLIPGLPLTCPRAVSSNVLASFDAIILLAWLFWEQHKHRIIDYV